MSDHAKTLALVAAQLYSGVWAGAGAAGVEVTFKNEWGEPCSLVEWCVAEASEILKLCEAKYDST